MSVLVTHINFKPNTITSDLDSKALASGVTYLGAAEYSTLDSHNGSALPQLPLLNIMETENKENVKRARNFSDFDKNLLFEIVQKYINIIENKQTDATNIKIKNEIWDSSGNRTSKQLHDLYDGIKKSKKKPARG
ncbi:hypothetical protein NQ315_006600 [Exocentrus adspersus]|uniref:Regulatory protein zeste n=1 Tax=Exocentrus adspersus TaxID=1586481 RepID=A0AAV8VG03_9CUCU|nr:hypothetical protein NQ315_006600 [Exocentrus adspersus]